MNPSAIRQATPEDYDAIVAVAGDWWGRDVLPGLPRLFLDHFFMTSLVADDKGVIVGFLVGFHSPSQPLTGYIHYVGVHPNHRRSGLARRLYDEFMAEALKAGRTVVRAVTSPVNQGSIAFHQHMGFVVTEPVPNYNGPRRDMVTFTRELINQPPPTKR